MHRQVGDLATDSRDIAYRGLLARHLVMPYNIAHTEKIMDFIANEISTKIYVNIMAQYYPAHMAYGFEGLKRGITKQEFSYAIESAKSAGLKNIRSS